MDLRIFFRRLTQRVDSKPPVPNAEIPINLKKQNRTSENKKGEENGGDFEYYLKKQLNT